MVEILKNKLIDRYFSHSLDIQIQSFHLLAIAGTLAGVVVAVFSAVIRAGAASIAINLALAALGYFMLWIAEKTRSYRLCGWITVIVVFLIAFPLLFFGAGGYRSGMPCFFIAAFIFTAVILDGRGRTTALLLEFLSYAACCLTAYRYPETITGFPSEFTYFGDVMIGVTVSGLLLLFVVLLHIRFYHGREKNMRELIRELTARSEALTRYDRMKSDFLATVAHEINTPLAVISASSDDSLDMLDESPLNLDELKENQRIIVKRVKLIDSIILDLMDTVAIENGRLSLNRQPADLSALLKQVCGVHFKQLDRNNNRIAYLLQPGLPQIWLDPIRIEQVMTNLISNAVYYTRDGVITIVLEQKDGSQIVRVADNGEGMDQEMARMALKQYVSSKAEHWRHGIGLHICRQIVAAHGGEIWIDSVLGRGATVSFSLREDPEYA